MPHEETSPSAPAAPTATTTAPPAPPILGSRQGVVTELATSILQQRGPRAADAEVKPIDARPDRGVFSGVQAALRRSAVDVFSGTVRTGAPLTQFGALAVDELVSQSASLAGSLAPSALYMEEDTDRTQRRISLQVEGLDAVSRGELPDISPDEIISRRESLDELSERLRISTLGAEQRRLERQAGVIRAVAPLADEFNQLADTIDLLKDSDLLYKSPSLVASEQENGVFGAMVEPGLRWWYESVPEFIGQAASTLLPATAVRKASLLLRASNVGAMRAAVTTGAAIGFAVETGHAYDEIRDDLVRAGYTSDEAAAIATMPAVVYGVAAGWVERGLLPFQLRRAPGVRKYIKQVLLAGGVGEGAEEVAQDSMRSVARVAVGLHHGITFDSVAHGFIGGFFGGAGITSITGARDALRRTPQTLDDRINTMTPIERAEYLRTWVDRRAAIAEEGGAGEAVALHDDVIARIVARQRADVIPMPEDPEQTAADFADQTELIIDARADTNPVDEFRSVLPELLPEHPPIEEVTDFTDRPDLDAAVSIGRRLGVNVVVTTPVRRADGVKLTGFAPKDRRSVVITTDKQGADALLGVVGHEYVHQIETSGPLYQDFVTWVEANDAAGLEASQRDYYNSLRIGAASGQSFDSWRRTGEGRSEGIARYVERRLGTAGLHSKLASNPSLLQRMRDQWRRLMVRLGRRVTTRHASLDRITQLFDEAGDGAAVSEADTAYADVAARFAAEPSPIEDRKFRTQEDMLTLIPVETRTFEGGDQAPSGSEPAIGAVKVTQAQLNKIARDRVRRTGKELVDQSVEIVRLRAKDDAMRLRPPSAAFVRRAMKLPARFRFWYEDYVREGEEKIQLSAGVRQVWNAVLSATSQRATVEDNVIRTLSVMSEVLAGQPVRTDLIDPKPVAEALQSRIFDRTGSESLKTGNFNQTYEFIAGRADTAPLPTIDTLMMQVYGLHGSAVGQGPLYEAIAGMVIDLTGLINQQLPPTAAPLQPWQTQALLWVEQQQQLERERAARQGRDVKPLVMKTYGEVLDAVVLDLQAAGLLPEQVNGTPPLTEQTMANPLIAEHLRPIRDFKAARVITMEVASELTANGRLAREMRDRLASSDNPVSQDKATTATLIKANGDPGGYETIQIRALDAIAARGPYEKPSGKTVRARIITELASAVTGRTANYASSLSDLSIIDLRRHAIPKKGDKGDVLGPAGTYMGATNINGRFPLTTIEDPADRMIILAAIGRAFTQDAMAASTFTHRPEGEDTAGTETWGMLLPGVTISRRHVEAIQRVLRGKADIGGASLMSEQAANGAMVYVTPNFDQDTPKAIDRSAFEAAVAEVFEGQDIEASSHAFDFESDFVPREDYDTLIDARLKEHEDAESTQEWIDGNLSGPERAAVALVAPGRRERRQLLRRGRAYSEQRTSDEDVRATVARSLDKSRTLRFVLAASRLNDIALRLDSDLAAFRRVNEPRLSGEAPDAGRAAGVVAEPRGERPGAEAVTRPLRQWHQFYHFGQGDRTGAGIEHRYAGTNVVGRAGQRSERQRILAPDRDLATAPVFLYMPDRQAEAIVVQSADVMHQIEAEVALIALGSDDHHGIIDILNSDGAERTSDQTIDAFVRTIVRAGYDGMAEMRTSRPGFGTVQLYRDVLPDEIVEAIDLTPEKRRELGREDLPRFTGENIVLNPDRRSVQELLSEAPKSAGGIVRLRVVLGLDGDQIAVAPAADITHADIAKEAGFTAVSHLWVETGEDRVVRVFQTGAALDDELTETESIRHPGMKTAGLDRRRASWKAPQHRGPRSRFAAEPADAITLRVSDSEGRVIKEETFRTWEAARPWANSENAVEGQEVEVEFPNGGGRMQLRPGKRYTGEAPDESPAGPIRDDEVAAWGAAQLMRQPMQFDEWESRMLRRFGDEIRPRLRKHWHAAQEYARLWSDEQSQLTSRRSKRVDESTPVRTTEQKLLNLRFREQARGARASAKTTKAAEQAKAKATIAEVSALHARRMLRVGIEQRAKGRREREKEIRQERGRLVARLKAAVKLLPPGARIPIGAINANSDAAVDATIKAVQASIERHERQEAIRGASRALKSLKKTKLRPEFEPARRNLLASVDPAAMTERTRLSLIGLRETLATQGVEPTPKMQSALARLDKTPLSDMTTDDIRQIQSAVELLMNASRKFNQFITDTKRTSLDAQITTVNGELQDNLVQARIDEATGQPKRTTLRDLALPLRADVNLKPDTMAEFISGSEQSETHDLLYGAVNRGRRRALGGFQAALDFLQVTMESAGFRLGSEALARMSFALSGDYTRLQAVLDLEVKDALKGPVRTERRDIVLTSGEVLTASTAELMSIYAATRDPTTLAAMTNPKRPSQITLKRTRRGERFTLSIDDVQSITDSLSPQERAIVDALVQYVNTSLREPMQRWHIEKRGWDNTSDDIYWPRRRQRTRHAPEDATFETFGSSAHLSAAGITKERVVSSEPIVIEDVFVTFSNLAWQTHHVAEMEPAIANARTVLSSDAVRTTMAESRFGGRLPTYWNKLYDNVARSAIGGPRLAGPVEDWIGSSINRVTKGLLAANPFVMLYQVVSVVSASTEISSRWLSEAVLGGAMFSDGVRQRMMAASPVLRERFESSSMGLINETSGGARQLLGFKPRGETLMGGIAMFDRAAIKSIWRAAELSVENDVRAGKLDIGLASPEFGEKTAERAERVVSRTQPMFDSMHLSGLGVEGRRNQLVRALTMFFSQRNQNMNMAVRAYMRGRRAASGKERLSQLKNMGLVTIAAPLAITAIKVLREFILNRGLDDDEDKAAQQTIATFMDSVVGNMYFGDIVNVPLKKVLLPEARTFDVELSPVVGTINDAFNGLVQVGRALTGDGYDQRDSPVRDGVTKFTLAAGALAGFQLTPLLRMIRRWNAESERPTTYRPPRTSARSRLRERQAIRRRRSLSEN